MPDPNARLRSGQSFAREMAAIALMSLAVLMVYWSPGADGYVQFASDYTELHALRMDFARELLLGPAHELPAWYPRQLLGTPFWSNPQNFPFIPTRLLVLLMFDPRGPYALTVAVSLAAILAALFTYLFCRRLGLTLMASAAAGWTFACSGFFASRIANGHLPLLEAYAALPLLLWCVESLVSADDRNERTGRWIVATSASSMCVVLAGHPQLPIYALVCAALYALWRGRGFGRAGRSALAALSIGVGCAGFVLVPAMLLIGRSTRVLALSRADNDIAMPYRRLLSFFLPWLDGAPPELPRGRWDPYRGNYPNVLFIWDTVCYIGWTPWIALAVLIALVLWRKKRIGSAGTFIAALGIAGIVLALPWVQALTAHFQGTFLRSPARLIYLSEFALAMALGAATDAVQRGALGKLTRLLVPLALLIHFADLRMHDLEYIVQDRLRDKNQVSRINTALRDQLGDEQNGARAAIDIDLAFGLNQRDVDDIEFFDSIMLARPYSTVLDLSGKPEGLNVQRLSGAELALPALRGGGVRAVVTRGVRNDLPLAAKIDNVNVYSIPMPAPSRAGFFRPDQVQFLDSDAMHLRLRDSSLDVSETLLLPKEAAPPPSSSIGEGNSTVAYHRPDPDHIECEITTATAGYLRVVESFDPGWSATVDGASVPIIPAMDALLCVALPTGTHRVQFVYHTPGAMAGVGISLVSLGMLCGWIIISARSRRRARAEAA